MLNRLVEMSLNYKLLVIIGFAVIAALGALELWQDWHKTDEEMTHYGSGPRHSHGYKPLKV